MTRRKLFGLLPLLWLLPGRAQATAVAVRETRHLRVVARGLGWTVLRDIAAPPDAAETAMVLVRAQRPVPPAARPGHLAEVLRHIRLFHFDTLPEEQHLSHHGLPAMAVEARGIGTGSRVPVMVRAVTIYGPNRSWLLIASAPAEVWPTIEAELDAVLEGFRPG